MLFKRASPCVDFEYNWPLAVDHFPGPSVIASGFGDSPARIQGEAVARGCGLIASSPANGIGAATLVTIP